jgi:hypothetical protein
MQTVCAVCMVKFMLSDVGGGGGVQGLHACVEQEVVCECTACLGK